MAPPYFSVYYRLLPPDAKSYWRTSGALLYIQTQGWIEGMDEEATSTVDMYFKNREIPYMQGIRMGDTVSVLPDTFVPFGEPALGVTPIYVTLTGGAVSKDNVPKGAFWVQLPSGACLFGKKWVSGKTTYR